MQLKGYIYKVRKNSVPDRHLGQLVRKTFLFFRFSSFQLSYHAICFACFDLSDLLDIRLPDNSIAAAFSSCPTAFPHYLNPLVTASIFRPRFKIILRRPEVCFLITLFSRAIKVLGGDPQNRKPGLTH